MLWRVSWALAQISCLLTNDAGAARSLLVAGSQCYCMLTELTDLFSVSLWSHGVLANALVSQAWLLLGWVTIIRWVKPLINYVTGHPGQLSLAIPQWLSAMSTSESWDINRHTMCCSSRVLVVSQCKLVFGWGHRHQRRLMGLKDFTIACLSGRYCVINF